jgi:transposase-like protein
MQIVERRDSETLLGLIQEHVQTGSIIYSDEWRAYCRLGEIGFEHSTVCHKYHFVDPVNNVHIQHVESYWSRQKLRIKRSKGCMKSVLQSVLNEYMFRDLFNDSLFDMIFVHLLNI